MTRNISHAEHNGGGRELVTAAADEVRALAAKTDGVVRKRLLVLTHVLELADRALATEAGPEFDAAALVRALRAGEHDHDLVEQAAGLREHVRRDLAVAHPGYDR